MATNFSREPKMQTTEPSVDEAKLKKGGRAHKKHMADGGVPMVTPRVTPAMASRARMMARPPMAMPVAEPAAPRMAAMPMRPMKKGGEAESSKSDMAQDKAMIKKAFKQHDTQEHKGGKGTNLKLKKGGKMATGGLCAPGYKAGGHVKHSAMRMDSYGHTPMKKGGSCSF